MLKQEKLFKIILDRVTKTYSTSWETVCFFNDILYFLNEMWSL